MSRSKKVVLAEIKSFFQSDCFFKLGMERKEYTSDEKDCETLNKQPFFWSTLVAIFFYNIRVKITWKGKKSQSVQTFFQRQLIDK